MRWHCVLQGRKHGLGAAGVLLLPVAQHVADLHTLQVGLAAAQRARDDREVAVRGPTDQVLFGHIGQGADDHEFTVVAGQFWGHTLELATKKNIQEKGLQHVVTVVTEREFVAFEAACHVVQNAPAQAAAQAAHGLAFRDIAFDDGVGVLGFNMKLDAQLGQVLGQDVIGKTRLFLVQIDGYDFKTDRRALLHLEQNIQHAVAVFATRHAHHHAVAVFDHVEVHDGLAYVAAQAFLELVRFALDPGFFGIFDRWVEFVSNPVVCFVHGVHIGLFFRWPEGPEIGGVCKPARGSWRSPASCG